MQGRDDRKGIPCVAAGERGDARVSVRCCLDQAVLLQPGECLADWRAAQPEPFGQLGVLELLAGLERPVEDRIAETGVGLVAEQRSRRRALLLRNWNVKY